MVTSSARHRRFARHAAPLVQINCAALPESLAESELFGHVKGAARRLELDPSNLHKLARRLGLK